jgi:hypothetical protein
MSETPTALRREPLSEEAIDLLKRGECLGWSQVHLDLFIYQCNRTGLDPLARQIYGQLRWDKNLRDARGKKGSRPRRLGFPFAPSSARTPPTTCGNM